MHIQTISDITEEVHEALQRLVPQLGAHKIPPTREELKDLVASGASTLLVARDGDAGSPIVGMLCLTVYRVPTGLRSIIEDVVVDGNVRRRGIGEALVRHAIELARASGADGVSLTSNPQREAANGLYQSMGFQLRQTNPYFYRLK
ncbi:MAG TPA: GNAT family N-acetyltransferase [Anaerolineales bacterium]|jgi:ribosomal protein S18 acetylase RimI-like enzyme|nr:GNAT family N-acetyltransferase [Anaerolineales bacterium]